jgi:flagellar P-ring protein precursor FlgI
MRNAPFTQQALKSMLDRLGVDVSADALRVRNVAGVAVTAMLPPFASVGSPVDVTVSSLGDATSLKGGTLLMTPLAGGDGQVYAVAQGPIAVSGFTASGQGETLSQGVATDGRIPNGAIVERAVAGGMDDLNPLVLELFNPDFKTAAQVAEAVNTYSRQAFGSDVATARDMRSIVMTKPAVIGAVAFLASIGDLEVEPDVPARVVIDQSTGTVVIGQDVQISTVALTHGNLTVRITEMPQVSQPAPFSEGQTAVTPFTQVTAAEESGHLAVVGGTTLQGLVEGLNRIGLKPTDIIAILQAIKSAGALQAELIIQ